MSKFTITELKYDSSKLPDREEKVLGAYNKLSLAKQEALRLFEENNPKGFKKITEEYFEPNMFVITSEKASDRYNLKQYYILVEGVGK